MPCNHTCSPVLPWVVSPPVLRAPGESAAVLSSCCEETRHLDRHHHRGNPRRRGRGLCPLGFGFFGFLSRDVCAGWDCEGPVKEHPKPAASLYRSTGNVWQTTPKQCPEIWPCTAPEMIRLLGTLGDLPIFRVCQTLAVLGYCFPRPAETHRADRAGRRRTAVCLMYHTHPLFRR